MRPISLSNFINKVISRVLHDRLESILPTLISSNQSGFVKGRNIFENILLTQEIVSDIRIRGKPANVIIKLDMAKAYDRVSWKYLMHVLRKMGFAEHFINLIRSLIGNNWYSVLLNGQATGFFHSTRGVKQGDPLSPALFLLSTEVLSRALNVLFEDDQFIGRIMHVLREYEQTSGQLINKSKSSYYMYSKVGNDLMQLVGSFTGFNKGSFPFTYLGCPITHSRKKKVYYSELFKKVKGKLHSWKGKMLSFGGKAVLIQSVLQSMPIYLLSVIAPPKCVIKELHRIFARFFWNTREEGRSRHWVSWKDICLPTQEGGLGFKSLFDVSNALFAKLWWRFRTTSSLWENYMWNKYCKKEIPTLVQWKGGTQVWKKMLQVRDAIEHEIWWEVKGGTSNVWFENWTKLGALNYVVPTGYPINEELQDVADLIEGECWKDQILEQTFPTDIVEYIKSGIHIRELAGNWDRPWWMPTSTVPQQETIQHLFQTSKFASDVWSVFKQAVGIQMNLIQIHQVIRNWWKIECAEKFKPILHAVPAMIIWELWKRRNTIRHEGRVGDLIYAECKELGHNSNVVAEARAMLEGLIYCVNHELHPLILETDSLMLKNVVDGVWDTPWCIVTEVDTIRRLKDGTLSFNSFAELPSAGRRILNTTNIKFPISESRMQKTLEILMYKHDFVTQILTQLLMVVLALAHPIEDGSINEKQSKCTVNNGEEDWCR
ncbi:uncharacterized protein LOC132053773 [Lycium ferocissimum]|uniref:uncharacterized protein LOC132053773 n=1 Tax=Lycium ferocissimum TaxID=112874 RepID=UPI002815F9CC|nr:uncharacterized protein LOC132053773 [Lycium ferocissimum]